jgi:predicted amidohydrolase
MSKVKISACQFRMDPEINSVDDYFKKVEKLLDEVPHNSDYVLFPEHMTLPLLFSFDDFKNRNTLGIERLDKFTNVYLEFFKRQASLRKFHIIAGSHVNNIGEVLRNTCFIFTPDGKVLQHSKTTRTPTELNGGINEGNSFQVFDVGPAKIGIAICYECEFPEVARIYAEQGIDILFCPTWTTSEFGFWRTRYTAHARGIENQIFVVQSYLVGDQYFSLKGGYGRSAILTPCDSPWNPNGILVEAETNQNMVISGVVDLNELHKNREAGYVSVYKDYKRRLPLYESYQPYM